ncbi:MAG TPA: menaquinone biosynthesis protein [Pyrinomonadaceae bacterium]|nr:menaquinone biosynthesis protein [Pyrinomonadaceae bacterium]
MNNGKNENERIAVDSLEEDLPRVAASSYLNTAPLIWSFIQGRKRDEVELVTDTAPARCADMLSKREVNAALVPVIEYQRIHGLKIVPGVCVGAREAVRSVVLVARDSTELKDVRVVALDVSSRTSAALVRIIFREFLGFEPEWVTRAPDLNSMLRNADAALLIGDPAMTFSRAGLMVHDMAGLWRKHTGLGFVFAMWMAREEDEEKVFRVDFARARDEGLEHVEEIAAEYNRTIGLPLDEIRSYLSENISFTLDEEMRAGLKLYYELAHKHGMIKDVQPLRTIEMKA